jgi:hypothetical protein
MASPAGQVILARVTIRGSESFHNLFHNPGHALSWGNQPPKVSYFFNICGNLRSYSVVTMLRLSPFSNGVRSAQNPHWEEEERPKKRQNAVHRDAYDPERQQDQPHEWIRNQRQQRNRPAKYQQQAPQEESSHDQLTSLAS